MVPIASVFRCALCLLHLKAHELIDPDMEICEIHQTLTGDLNLLEPDLFKYFNTMHFQALG